MDHSPPTHLFKFLASTYLVVFARMLNRFRTGQGRYATELRSNALLRCSTITTDDDAHRRGLPSDKIS